MTPEHEIISLALNLFNASCKFVEARIASERNSIFFIESAWIVARCINEKNTLAETLEILNNLKATEEKKKFPRTFLINPRYYRLLAIHLALDIFSSMQRRYRGQHEDSPSGTFTLIF